MVGSYMETLRRVLDGDYQDASDEEKARAVKELIQVCSVAASALTIQPFPIVDSALMAPIQIAMVQGIGRIHGHKLDKTSVLEILSTFGATIVGQNLIMAAAKLIPFFGWAVTISMAYALTYAIGEVSDHYFKHGRAVSKTELKSMFERVYKEKKSEKEASAKEDARLKDRLEQIKEAFKEGLITEEEFEHKKQAILRDL